MKRLVFRFDVDTHKCVEQGMPNLLSLARKHKVKFTFFVHFGKSVSQKDFLRKFFKKTGSNTHYANLSAFTKLGLKDYLITALINPQIGKSGSKYILEAILQGHEIGLHGGKNHELWNIHALKWRKHKIAEEIQWGVKEMSRISPKYKMKGFASPHWKGNNKIYSILKDNGFTYVSDIHTNKPVQKIDKRYILPNIPNNISGEPGGVGYIEWCRAHKMSDAELLKDFARNLSKRRNIATVYDHPYYSGVAELDILEKMIVLAKQKQYKIVTLGSILEK